MATKGEQLAAIAQSYIGTPFWEHGREPGVALDCAGVVICALAQMGIACDDPPYHLTIASDHGPLLETALAKVFSRVESAFTLTQDSQVIGLEVGDVLVYRAPMMPNHCAVYIGETVIVHAIQGAKNTPATACGVVETPMDYSIISRIKSVWRLMQ